MIKIKLIVYDFDGVMTNNKVYIDQSGKEFGKGRKHINGLEGFWSFAKERLLKYHGVSKAYFHLYLKEMEFRYNYRKENIYHKLIKIHFSPFFN